MEDILKIRIEKIIKTLILSLQYHQYKDFVKSNNQIRKDIKLIIYLKKYLGILTKNDTFNKIFNHIKENLEIVK